MFTVLCTENVSEKNEIADFLRAALLYNIITNPGSGKSIRMFRIDFWCLEGHASTSCHGNPIFQKSLHFVKVSSRKV